MVMPMLHHHHHHDDIIDVTTTTITIITAMAAETRHDSSFRRWPLSPDDMAVAVVSGRRIQLQPGAGGGHCSRTGDLRSAAWPAGLQDSLAGGPLWSDAVIFARAHDAGRSNRHFNLLDVTNFATASSLARNCAWKRWRKARLSCPPPCKSHGRAVR